MKKKLISLLMAAMSVVAMSVTAFAAEGEPFTITTEMLQPVVDGVTANIAVIFPVGLSLFAIFIGIRLVPRLIRNFTRI